MAAARSNFVARLPRQTEYHAQPAANPGNVGFNEGIHLQIYFMGGDQVDPRAWIKDVPITGQKVIEPDARVVDAFQNIGYSLEAAVADLIDNSIDAGGKRVLVRFVRTNDELHSLDVTDDGRGMNDTEIDRAMKFGGQRAYQPSDQGIYGMGLKAASLSQADNLTVISRTNRGTAVGRRWQAEEARRGWQCDVVSGQFANDALDAAPNGSGLSHGTIVRWDQVRDFRKASGRVDAYIQRVRNALTFHLGLQLHRFLAGARPRLQVSVSTFNVDTNQSSPHFGVTPLDPFSYTHSGAKGYPKDFRISIPQVGNLTCHAHIWPPRTQEVGYKLGGGSVARRQGFYFYRNDRLLQAGGWNNYREDGEPHLSLARAGIDLPQRFQGFFSIRFNKAAVDAPRSFVDAIEDAKSSDGILFPEFVERAIAIYRSKPERKLDPVFAPGRGIRAAVREAVRSTRSVLPRHTVDVVWVDLPRRIFFEIDREKDQVLLNKKFRSVLLGGRTASSADLPVIKTLLYLLTEELFHSERQSGLERQRLEAYQAALVAAVREEE
jgi:hypothetical protein